MSFVIHRRDLALVVIPLLLSGEIFKGLDFLDSFFCIIGLQCVGVICWLLLLLLCHLNRMS